MFVTGLRTAQQQSILLIDDDAVSREVTATLLTLAGFAVQAVDGGQTALCALADGSQPAYILMDAQMPGLHGVELLARLRQSSTAPVVVVSGSQPQPELAEAAEAVLLKPFGLEAVRQLLAGIAESAPRHARRLATDDEQPIVRREILAQFRAAMPEASVRQIYAAIVADLERRAAALEAAFAAGDCEQIRRIGHAIKGGCAMAGAAQAARLGARLEEDPSCYQSDNNRPLLDDLRAAALRLKRMLEVEFSA